MKKTTLSLSLLIGAALTIPSLAMAAPAGTTAVDMQTAPTLEAEGNNTNDIKAANQSNPFQLSETQIIKRAKVNNIASQQPMTTELQAEQENIQSTMQEDMQAQQAAMQNSDEAMQQQDLQQAMLDEEAALQEETLLESE
ncbi:hypothetical protein [Psychrobacter immobilis]|uniref:hypothetical protein n=1 Tax=Psychrobacter immobilis TaxID=498 RepID=UPI001918B326|nr:hypothetical protein [Psychrobacter immobilis]